MMSSWWMAGLRTLGLALLPPACLACRAPLWAHTPLGLCADCTLGVGYNTGPRCGRCDEAVRRGERHRCALAGSPIVRLRAPLAYDGVIVNLVRRGKFAGGQAVWAALAQVLARDAAACAMANAATHLVCIPLGARRARERGYNQSAMVARAFGRACGLPVCHAIVRRTETLPQSLRTVAERWRNVEGAFACRRRLVGPVVLVDDVVTSGATLCAAAQALHAAGTGPIAAVALARTQPR